MSNTMTIDEKKNLILVATKKKKADLVLKNATYVNVFANELSHGDIAVYNGKIAGIGEYSGEVEYDMTNKIVLPGFIDSHIHLESALLAPKETAKALIAHGTTTLFTDPHEISNVMGTDGLNYMIQATKGLPVEVHFMLPSCVPASAFEDSGANLDSKALKDFYKNDRVSGLAEFMDFIGVTNGETDAMQKIIDAESSGKMVDGHAPMLEFDKLNGYVAAGICSDHECFNAEDALTKLRLGQYIMIREGTAASNLEALVPLLVPEYADRCMFCVDDRHPSDILNKGHIDYICKKAIGYGADPVLVSKVASYNAAKYFKLDNVGAIAPNYYADFVVIDNFKDFNIELVFKRGKIYFDGEVKEFETPKIDDNLVKHAHDTFHLDKVDSSCFKDEEHSVIGMINGEIITKNLGYAKEVSIEKDILKIAGVERHKNTGHIGNGFIHGYGLKSGAVATSICHDSHNIIVVGTNADDMAFAVNKIIDNHGGIVVVDNQKVVSELVLEIAGIMTDSPIEEVNATLEATKQAAFKMGVNKGVDPFMTLSFMALPVIPEIRITTRGLFDVDQQKFIK